jgi:hypothetical protein
VNFTNSQIDPSVATVSVPTANCGPGLSGLLVELIAAVWS